MALHEGRLDDARAALRDADGIRDFFDPYAVSLRAEVAVVVGAPDASELVARADAAAAENDWAWACVARARGRLTGDDALLRDAVDAFERIGARFEWATTALLLDDLAEQGRAVLTELGCSPDLPIAE